MKIKSRKHCMYYQWLGGLQTGRWRCTLLTHAGHKGNPVQCKGHCQFYDEGIKNKHGVIVRETKGAFNNDWEKIFG